MLERQIRSRAIVVQATTDKRVQFELLHDARARRAAQHVGQQPRVRRCWNPVQVHVGGMPDAYRLHVVLEATDAGSPRLTRYRRAIIEMPTGGRPTKGKTCPRIAVSLQPADVNFDTGTFPTTAAFSTDSDIRALLDHPAARAVLERLAPEVAAGASSNAMVRNMTLRSLRSLDPRMTEERLTAIDVELAKVAPK